jgi:hypothetical protein
MCPPPLVHDEPAQPSDQVGTTGGGGGGLPSTTLGPSLQLELYASGIWCMEEVAAC